MKQKEKQKYSASPVLYPVVWERRSRVVKKVKRAWDPLGRAGGGRGTKASLNLCFYRV